MKQEHGSECCITFEIMYDLKRLVLARPQGKRIKGADWL